MWPPPPRGRPPPMRMERSSVSLEEKLPNKERITLSCPGDAHAAGAKPPRAYHSYAVDAIIRLFIIQKYFRGRGGGVPACPPRAYHFLHREHPQISNPA